MAAPSESPEHLQLKRMALQWALEHGYPIAATEVSVPCFRCRLDVAAYRPARRASERIDSRTNRRRTTIHAEIGFTAIFECKASRTDCRRDTHSIAATRERMARLALRKERQEETLRVHYPSIRNGDSLFPEYESVDFERPGFELYQRTLREMRRLASRLREGTKFEQLTQWRAANLYYLVAEPGVIARGEMPVGWGLLVRDGETLRLEALPHLQEAEVSQRLLLLHRIAMAGTRAVVREDSTSNESERSARSATSVR